MSLDDLAVLAIPAVLVTGLVLLGLGLDGRARKTRPRRWSGRCPASGFGETAQTWPLAVS